MEQNNIQYYLYQEAPRPVEHMVMVEENVFLENLQEAALYRRNERPERELAAAVGMILMHYQAVPEPEPITRGQVQMQNQTPNNPIAKKLARRMKHQVHKKRVTKYKKALRF